MLAAFVAVSLMLTQPHWFGLPSGAFRPYPLLPFLLWLALRADARITAPVLAWLYAVSADTLGWARCVRTTWSCRSTASSPSSACRS